MEKDAKIYVAGHRGLVGSAIWKNLQQKGYTNLVGRTHAELDLLDGVAVREFFDAEKPDYVILAAAFVGGESSDERKRNGPAAFSCRAIPFFAGYGSHRL